MKIELDEMEVLHKVGEFLEKEFPQLCVEESFTSELTEAIFSKIKEAAEELNEEPASS